MGNVERCDKTLPLNEMIFYVRRDAALRARWLTDLAGLARETSRVRLGTMVSPEYTSTPRLKMSDAAVSSPWSSRSGET